jgi:hypothetical protein
MLEEVTHKYFLKGGALWDRLPATTIGIRKVAELLIIANYTDQSSSSSVISAAPASNTFTFQWISHISSFQSIPSVCSC